MHACICFHSVYASFNNNHAKISYVWFLGINRIQIRATDCFSFLFSSLLFVLFFISLWCLKRAESTTYFTSLTRHTAFRAGAPWKFQLEFGRIIFDLVKLHCTFHRAGCSQRQITCVKLCKMHENSPIYMKFILKLFLLVLLLSTACVSVYSVYIHISHAADFFSRNIFTPGCMLFSHRIWQVHTCDIHIVWGKCCFATHFYSYAKKNLFRIYIYIYIWHAVGVIIL